MEYVTPKSNAALVLSCESGHNYTFNRNKTNVQNKQAILV